MNDGHLRTSLLVAGLLAFLLVVGGLLPASASTHAELLDQEQEKESDIPELTQVDPENVFINIGIKKDGSANWAVEYRVRLNNENKTKGFESVRKEIENNPSKFKKKFKKRMGTTVRSSERTTGRTMAINNITVDAVYKQLPQEYGVITYSFDWTGFAQVKGKKGSKKIETDKALSGIFLDNETSLLVSWPDGYSPSNVVPDPDNKRESSVVWKGPTNFASDEPRLSISAGSTGESSNMIPAELLGAVALLTAVLGLGVVLGSVFGGGWVIASQYRGETESAEETVDEKEETEEEVEKEEKVEEQETEEEKTEEEEGPKDTELMSNEERVLHLLEQNGGRMKQQEVVKSLGWTESKTSQVVKDLYESDKIDRFRLGRENVLSLPDEEDDDDIV